MESCAQQREREIYVTFYQETWREAPFEEKEFDGIYFVGAGKTQPARGFGSEGVGFGLSQRAYTAFQKSGSEHHVISPRLLGIRLIDDSGNSQFLVTAHFPDSGKSVAELTAFYDGLDALLLKVRPTDELIIGADCNADLGRLRTIGSAYKNAIGKYGLPNFNKRGVTLANWLLSNNLCAARTFFSKPQSRQWTWERKTTTPYAVHSIDHFLVRQSSLPKILDCGRCKQITDSDHRSIIMMLNTSSKSRQNVGTRRAQKKKVTKRDFSEFKGISEIALSRREEYSEAFIEEHAIRPNGESGWEKIEAAAAATLEKMVPLLPSRKGWFNRNKKEIMDAIKKRNEEQQIYDNLVPRVRDLDISKVPLRKARSNLKRIIRTSKDEWITNVTGDINGNTTRRSAYGATWKAIKELKEGLQKPKPPKQRRFKKPDGSIASTDAENLAVQEAAFSGRFNKQTSFDPSVLNLLGAQLNLNPTVFDKPTKETIIKFLKKIKADKATGISGLPGEAIAFLADDGDAVDLLKECIDDFFDTGKPPEEWLRCRLALAPKPDSPNKSDPNSFRPISVLEATAKLAGSLIADMLITHFETFRSPFFFGFLPKVGTTDALTTLKVALQKRAEHNLESYALFVDFIKAFDTVDRSALYAILLKLGVPEKIVRVVKALYSNVTMQHSCGAESSTFSYSVGVKQGDSLAPVLFLYFMQAALMTLDTSSWAAPSFKTKNDAVLHGRSVRTRGEDFKLPFSFYADDSAFIFLNRRDFETGSVVIKKHFERWGLEMHCGLPGVASKTKAMYFPPHQGPLSSGNRSSFSFPDGSHVDFVEQFKYLGCWLHYTLTDDYEVDQRLSKANCAFGALRTTIFSPRRIQDQAKRAAYVAMVLPALLFGSEIWTITATIKHKLQMFHNRCIRSMACVTMTDVMTNRISSKDLLFRFRLRPIDFYISRRRVRWFGRLARMDYQTKPQRRIISSWVQNPRLRTAPRANYGTSINKTLRNAKILPMQAGSGTWMDLARDPVLWMRVINGLQKIQDIMM
jgi:hypothetical protein